MSKYFTTKELAEYLHVTPLTIRRKSLNGELPSIKIGNRLRFDKDQIDIWLHGKNSHEALRILVIDDEPMIGQLIGSTLKKPEYEVTVTMNGGEAMAIMDSERWDMIFLDLMLPEIDGAKLFRYIRETHNEVPVAIITGFPDSTVMNEAMQYGPFTVLKKPFEPNDIFLVVQPYLKQKRR